MKRFVSFLSSALLILTAGTLYSQSVSTGSFHKVIISPFIAATFVQGDQERVVIESSVVLCHRKS